MTELIGTVSYGVAAVAFFVLLLLILTSWRGRAQGALLGVATFTSCVWAGVIAYYFAVSSGSLRAATVFEFLRDAAWLAFLASLLNVQSKADAQSKTVVWVVGATAAACLLLVVAAIAQPWLGSLQGRTAFLTDVLGRIVLSVMGIALVEQVYRNARAERRWSIKFMCLGVGGMFAYDFYLYANAALFKQIDVDVFVARGFVSALVAPLVAVSAARNPTWSLDIAISRQVIFHSATLVGAGVYLLLMAAAGYYIRFFGGSWGGVLQAAFLFGALLLLMLMLVSGAARAHLKVLLSKHFFTHKFDYREEWLRFTKLLAEGEPGVRLRERSIEAIAGLVESPGGALWLRQDNGAFERAAHWNYPQAQGVEPSNSLLVQFLEEHKWVIDVPEAQVDPGKYSHLLIPQWLATAPRAWLVVPLVLHERLVGFVLLAHSRGEITFNWEVSDLLKTAGRQAASYLAQLEAARALLVARQFEHFNRMSAFVVHDLKNLVSQLSLLLSNARKHRRNPAFFDDMVETVQNSVDKMQRLLTQLRSGSPSPAGLSIVDLEALLQQVVAAKENYLPRPVLEIIGKGLQLRADRERLERIMGHLIQNAVEATPKNGKVAVTLKRENDCAVVEVQDTGKGMSREFIRENLFQPFDTTKSGGMGIGAYESREYVRELGGTVEVESEPGHGTTFSVSLPLATPHAISDNVLPLRGVQ
jgi:putative PEP-CTERM system histidine kinase